MTWQFILVGLGLGLVVGLTGVGGGSLMTPILIIFFGFTPGKAVGTDIFHSAIFKSFGAWRHRRLGTVHGHLALWLFAGSGPLAIAGVTVSWLLQDQLSNAETILKFAIGVALILGGLGFLAKSFIRGGVQSSTGPFIMSRRDKVVALATGAVFGFMVGLTSVGSGDVLRPHDGARLPADDVPDRRDGHLPRRGAPLGRRHRARRSSATSTGTRCSSCCIGSIPGILVSSRWTVKVPDMTIRLGLGGILIISGINLVDVHKHLPNWAFASLFVALAVAVAAYTVVAMRRPRPLPERA